MTDTRVIKIERLERMKITDTLDEITPKVMDFILLGIVLDTIYVKESERGVMTPIKNNYILDTLFTLTNDLLFLGGLEFFPEYNGLKFSELPINIIRKINDFNLTFCILSPATDAKIINFVKE